MDYQYQAQDFKPMTYELLDSSVRRIYQDIDGFLKRENLRVKYIVPILRGGGIPGTLLAYFFDIIDMLPIQVKSRSRKRAFDIKVDFNYDVELAPDECLLLVDGNHATGKTAKLACQMITRKLPNAKIIYACVTQDYAHRDVVTEPVFTTSALYTNETKVLTPAECSQIGIDYAPVYLYPWEDKKTEMDALNEE